MGAPQLPPAESILGLLSEEIDPDDLTDEDREVVASVAQLFAESGLLKTPAEQAILDRLASLSTVGTKVRGPNGWTTRVAGDVVKYLHYGPTAG